jgi:DNA-binding response OmpR family regulator
LKESGCKTPIIMLTARGTEDDKIEGFEAGADDYITKPFSLKELLMRVKAVLRRTQQDEDPVHEFAFGDIQLNFDEYSASKNGIALDLSPREFEIMRLFVQHEGDTVTRELFLEKVWGYTTVPATRTVDNHIAKLRQKIEDDAENPRHIITLHRIGYKFIP